MAIKVNRGLSPLKLNQALENLAKKMVTEKKWKSAENLSSEATQMSEKAAKPLQNWIDQVITSTDVYYASIIASNASLNKPKDAIFDNTAKDIENAKTYLEYVNNQVAKNPDEFAARRYGLVDAASQLLTVANLELQGGNTESAQIALELSLASADAAISLTPLLGWGKDILESWTGYSVVSGKKLTTIERSLAIAGAVSGGIGSAVGVSAKVLVAGTVTFSKAAKLSKTAEEFAEIEKAAEAVAEMGKNAEKAAVSVELVSEGVRATQKVLSEGKHIEAVAQDGRSVYKLKEIETVPKMVDRSVSRSIQERLAAGETNIDLMKNGNAPIGADGRQINLHHVFGREPGAMIEMESTAHKVEYAEFHKLIDGSFRRDKALEASYATFRRSYWINRSKELNK